MMPERCGLIKKKKISRGNEEEESKVGGLWEKWRSSVAGTDKRA
jgi:hypothetical protein